MKKLLLAVIAVFFIGNLNAQDVKFGAKAGLNIASINGGSNNADARTGFHIGLISELEISDHFSVQPELLYSMQGSVVEDFSKIKLDYLSLPVLAKYYITEGFSIEAGPQFSFLVNDVIDFDQNVPFDDTDTNAENFDLSAAVGLGYKITSKIFAQARYTVGVTTIEENPDLKNGVFQFSLGYQF